jgi:Transmembrane secretion effector
VQNHLPRWAQARGLAVYQLVLHGCFAGSAASWGLGAQRQHHDRLTGFDEQAQQAVEDQLDQAPIVEHLLEVETTHIRPSPPPGRAL